MLKLCLRTSVLAGTSFTDATVLQGAKGFLEMDFELKVRVLDFKNSDS